MFYFILPDLNGLQRGSVDHMDKKRRNYKLVVDPLIHRGQSEKVYRFDGQIPGVSIGDHLDATDDKYTSSIITVYVSADIRICHNFLLASTGEELHH